MATPHRCDCFGSRPPVPLVLELTESNLTKLKEEHRPYKATAGILCLACSLPNNPDDPHASVTTFYPCLIARLIEHSQAAVDAAVAELTAEIERLKAENERVRAWVQRIADRDIVPEGDEASYLNALKWSAGVVLRPPAERPS